MQRLLTLMRVMTIRTFGMAVVEPEAPNIIRVFMFSGYGHGRVIIEFLKFALDVLRIFSRSGAAMTTGNEAGLFFRLRQ